MSANAAPNRQPRNSDELNMPPRKPAPSESAEARSFAPNSSSSRGRVKSPSNTSWMAPWPLPRTCGTNSAMPLTGGPQPLRQRQAPQPAFRPGHRLHRQHTEAGGQDAEQREQQVEPLAEVIDDADAEQWRRVHERAQGEGGGERRGGHRRQRPHGIAAQDELVAVEGAGQGRVEGRGDGGGGAGAD